MTHSKDKLVGWLAPVLVMLLTVVAFFPVLQNGFVDWDDDVNIFKNLNYRGLGWKQLRWMFTNFSLGHYQPLSWVTLGLDYVLWGMNPFGYHLTNLILHGVNALIFYFVALRLLSAAFRKSMDSRELPLREAAGFAALLFSLHPLRVESVAWVTERRGLLAGTFFLLSVLCYLRASAVPEGGGTRLRWMAAAVTTYGLSLLSKASGLALPVVFLALDVYPLGRLGGGLRSWLRPEKRKVLWEKVPCLLLALAAVAGALIAEHEKGAVHSLQEYGIFSRIGQAFFGLTFYPWKTLVPSGLFPMYGVVGEAVPAYWPFHPTKEVILALSIIIALAISVILFLLRHRWPAGLCNWVCYVSILAPVLGIVRIGVQIAADRYSYLACLGWAMLAGGGVIHLWRLWKGGLIGLGRLGMTGALAVGVLVGLGTLTWKQTQVWRNSDTLFGHVLAVSPRSKIAYLNFGSYLADRGELDEAIKHFRQSLQLDPDYPLALFDLAEALSRQGELDEAIQSYRHFIRINHSLFYLRLVAYKSLGIILAKQGKLEEAAEFYRQAIEIAPTFVEAHNNLGYILAGRGKLDEAVGHYRKALDLNPAFALAHVNLGDALVGRGQVDEAIGHFRKALESEPGLATAHYSLGGALAGKGQLGEAIEQYGEAVKSDPSYAVAYYDMGDAYFKRGEYKKAIEQYRQAVKINPSYAAAHYNMGNTLLKVGEIGGAIDQYRQAVKYDSRYAEAHSNWGSALEARGEVEEAIEHYRRAVEINPRYAAAHYNWGNTLLRKGDLGGAIERYRRAIEIDPRYVEALTNLGSALDAHGEEIAALEQYRKALELDPRSASAHYNLGLLLVRRGDAEGGVEHFRLFIKLNPADAEAHYHLGTFLALVGQVDEAAGQFKEALKIRPGYAAARERLNQLLAQPRKSDADTQP